LVLTPAQVIILDRKRNKRSKAVTALTNEPPQGSTMSAR